MQSQNLFDPNPESGRRPQVAERSHLPWVLLLTTLVPGGGHFVLGHVALGAALLATAVVGTAAGFAARFHDWITLGWFLHRAAVLAWVFALLDATLLEQERVDRRVDSRDPRSRVVGFLNALGWGAGFLSIGERALGCAAILVGASLHVVLAMRGQPLVWLGEILAIALSFWGATKAEERGSGGVISTELGALRRSGPVRVARQDTTPRWYAPVVLSLILAGVSASVVSWTVVNGWLDSRFVHSEGAVAVEPYYRHDEYGVALEMHAPGWAFREAGPETFVFAQHLAEDMRVALRLRPRMPLLADDERAARKELELMAPGFTVRSVDTATVGGLDGIRLEADGMRNNRRTFIEIFTAGRGFRRYVLQAEWTTGHEDFARTEIEELLRTAQLEGREPDEDSMRSAR